MSGDELHQWVGCYVEKAASQIVWKTPVAITEILIRVFATHEAYIRLLRQTSPCYCVLQKSCVVCTACPLNLSDASKRRTVRELMKDAVTIFKREMRYFPEYERDKSPDYVECDLHINDFSE